MSRARQLFRVLLGQRLPVVSGELRVPGVAAEVTIRRDAFGIPHVDAASDEDAWFGVGFCQGQDRSFQLETLLRLGRGTLAELLGAKGLPLDRLSRRIGFHHLARAYQEHLTPAQRGVLGAFAAGVNAGARWGVPKVAHEFALLRSRPSAWAAEDVIGVLLLQSFLLASNWDIELGRLKILELDGPEALAAIDPGYPSWLPVICPPGQAAGPALTRLLGDVAILRGAMGVGGASNNWAIAPSRTKSGRPILANDPHLPPMLPAHWYLCHVTTPGWAAAGAAMAGTPGIVAGHNGHVAWGVTAAHMDNTDLFVERIGADGRSVARGEGWAPCTLRREEIRVKGGATVVEEVLETSHGPIVGPAFHGEVGALAIRATWMRPQPVRGMMEIHKARSFAEFRAILSEWPAMPLSVAYADVDGVIGWQIAGQVPRRRKGSGTLPMPGWDPEVGWEEAPVPFAEMPFCEAPAAGYVATANNRPTSDESPFLGVDWLDGYREARISECLAGRHDWDVAATLGLQVDQLVIPWREIRALVLTSCADRPGLAPAYRLLEAWDGVASAESPAATIYELLIAGLFRRIAERKAPRSLAWALGRGFTDVVPHSLLCLRRTGHLVELLREEPGFFAEGWPAVIAAVVGEVLGRLRREFGADLTQWRWGRVRPLTMRHPVGDLQALAPIFNLGPMPCGGDGTTIPQASCDPAAPLQNPIAIASMRMVVDVGAWEEARFILPSGQSGNPLSPHYADMLALWQRGEAVPIAWSEGSVRAACRATLRLVPGKPAV